MGISSKLDNLGVVMVRVEEAADWGRICALWLVNTTRWKMCETLQTFRLELERGTGRRAKYKRIKQGTHAGRGVFRASGSCGITTQDGKVMKIHVKYLTILHLSDGYSYLF